MNLLSTVGAFLMGVAALLLVINMARTLLRGAPAGDNPWEAWTLEWATSSPPPPHNFDALPPIKSRRPLWDVANPDRPDKVVGAGTVKSPDKAKSAMWTLIASEAAFFGTLIMVFAWFNVHPPAGANAKNSLDLVKTGIFSVCLFASSFTLWRAEVAEQQKRRGGLIGWLILTIVLGAIFMVGQGSEYFGLYERGVSVTANSFASSFYLLTGFHGFHVTAGLIALAVVLGLVIARDFSKRPSPLVAIGLYWHFVDIVWIFVLLTVYILPRFL